MKALSYIARNWKKLLKFCAATAIAAIISTLAVGLSSPFTGWLTDSVSGAKSAKAREPVAVVVETNPSAISGLEYAELWAVLPGVARPTGNLGGGCAQFVPWAHSHGGVDAKHTLLRVVLQDLASTPVLISNLRVDKRSVAAPLHGATLFCPQAQGEAQVRAISIDLDKTPASVRYDFGQRVFGFTLGQGQTEVFDLEASTARSLVRWTMTLELVVGGKHVELPISDGGHPFQTTALPPRTPTWSWQGKWDGPFTPQI
jgi:hypothetical protein